MVTTTHRRYRRNRLGQFMPNPIRGRASTFPRQGRVIPVVDPFGRRVRGEYDREAPTGESVCNLLHGLCFHQGVGPTIHEAMKAAFAAYLASHGELDRAPSLIVAPT